MSERATYPFFARRRHAHLVLAVVAAAPKSQQQAKGRILLQTLLVHDVGDGFGREIFDVLVQHARLARPVMLVQPERHLKIICTVQHR